MSIIYPANCKTRITNVKSKKTIEDFLQKITGVKNPSLIFTNSQDEIICIFHAQFKKNNKWYYKRPIDGKEFEITKGKRYDELVKEETLLIAFY